MNKRHEPNKYSAAILAGGESRRMGYDKALLTAPGGKSNLRLLADSLSAHYGDVFIVRRRGVFEGSALPAGVRVVFDDMDEPGPMTGFVSALANAEGEYVFVCACDARPVLCAYMDLIDGRICRQKDMQNNGRVYAQKSISGGERDYAQVKPDSYDAVLPRTGGLIQPFWSLYNKRLLPQARAAVLAKRQSIFRFIEKRFIYIIEESEIVEAGIPASMFANQNE